MTAPDNISPAKRRVRSLPLHLWPEADRDAWNAACQPAARLKRGGAAGHLSRSRGTTMSGTMVTFLAFSIGAACSKGTARPPRM